MAESEVEESIPTSFPHHFYIVLITSQYAVLPLVAVRNHELDCIRPDLCLEAVVSFRLILALSGESGRASLPACCRESLSPPYPTLPHVLFPASMQVEQGTGSDTL